MTVRRTTKRRGWLGAALLIALLLQATSAGADETDRFGPDIIPAGKAVGTQRVYVVDVGDTLWDIAGIFYGEPLEWPLLWSFNPQVTNPHWIFPGDMIFLDPPRLVQKKEVLNLQGSRYDTGPKNVRLLARRMGFIPEDIYRDSGVIRGSREERRMMAQWDEIYIEFTVPKKIHKGEKYLIFRENKDRPIHHPRSGRFLGYLVQYLGEMKVLDKDARYARGLITDIYEEIVRGDRLTLRQDLLVPRAPRPNTASGDCIILANFRDIRFNGQNDTVLVDMGSSHGVQVGNRMIVLERGDGYNKVSRRNLRKYPYENVGEIMIVFAYEKHSLGVVTRSIHEFEKGMKVRMIRGY